MTERDDDTTAPDGCAAAHVALEKATHAEQRAARSEAAYRAVFGSLSALKAEVAGLRAEFHTAMESLGKMRERMDSIPAEVEHAADDSARHEVEKLQRILDQKELAEAKASLEAKNASDRVRKVERLRWTRMLVGLALTSVLSLITGWILARGGDK